MKINSSTFLKNEEPPPSSLHFYDDIWCHCPGTVMSRWFPRCIHGDTGFPQGLSLFSMVVDSQALLSY